MVLSWVCVGLILVGSILLTTDRLIGTPQRFGATVVATVLTPGVERALAASAVDEVAANSTGAIRQVVVQQRGVLEAAFVRTLNSERVRGQALAVATRLYQVASSGSTQSVNLRPLIVQFTAALHQVVPRVPAIPSGLQPQIEVRAKGLKSVGSISKSIGTLAWLGLIAGLLGGVLIARFLIRGHRKQLWSVGAIIGEPAVGLLVIAEFGRHATAAIHLGSNTGRLLIGSLVTRIAGALVGVALMLLALDLVVLICWQSLSVFRRRSGSVQTAA